LLSYIGCDGNISCRDFFTPRVWKSWLMGGGAKSVEHQRWPFLFVVVNMALGGLIFPLRIFANTTTITTLHLFTIFCMALMWTNFLLTYKTDPGSLSTESSDPTLAKVAGVLGQTYDEALESLGEETNNLGVNGSLTGERKTPLCHSCHLEKPLRSKHDRVTRRCILMFDHYCPFVGNAVGLYNYRFFYMYLFFHCLSITGFIISCAKHLSRFGFDWLTTLDMVWVGLFIIPGAGMFAYHTQLIAKNLTTNEQSNLWRYKYLQSEEGRYFNPFDGGLMHNFYVRIVNPGEATYTLEGNYSDRRSVGVGGGGGVGEEGDKINLIDNVV